jgi:hypothetical protein
LDHRPPPTPTAESQFDDQPPAVAAAESGLRGRAVPGAATGLRRFVRSGAVPQHGSSAVGAVPQHGSSAVGVATNTTDVGDRAGGGGVVSGRVGERCEMCTQHLPDRHTHLVDLTSRSLMCCCRACFFLFEPEGAGGGRYRPVPERYLHDPGFKLSRAQWDELAIPVGVVFVFAQSQSDQPVAFYPSPAGATESLLPLGIWGEVMQANPAFADARPDVEAVLLRREGESFDGYLVPIDACYDLVGRVRLKWKGFGGGEEVWQAVADFFGELTERADPVSRGRS